MSAIPKPQVGPNPVSDSKPKMPSTNHSADLADVFIAAVDRAVAIQKQWLEVAAQQNSEIIQTFQSLTGMGPTVSAAFDSTRQAFVSYIEIQKTIIELLAKQAAMLGELAQERDTSATFAAEITKVMQDSVNRVLAAQKNVLEISLRQMGTVQNLAMSFLPESERRWREEILKRSAHTNQD